MIDGSGIISAITLGLVFANSKLISDPLSLRHKLTLMGQGLTPAVVATLMIEYGTPYSQEILSIVTMVIIATNVVALIGARTFKAKNTGVQGSKLT